MRPEETFTEFYLQSKDACLRAVAAVCSDRFSAEEAVAEAFARAWASWSQVSRHPAPAAWVVRTALNHHVSRWRRTRRERSVPLAADAADRASPGVDPHDRAELVSVLRGLPQRQREVVVLRFLLDLTTEQTAAALGIAPGTVTAHLHRAMTTLRSQRHQDTEST